MRCLQICRPPFPLHFAANRSEAAAASLPLRKLPSDATAKPQPPFFRRSCLTRDCHHSGTVDSSPRPVVPHITDAIQEWIERVVAIPVDGKDGLTDVCVIELGGSIGNIELMPFIEALGQFSYRVGKVLCIALRNLMRMSRRNFSVLPCSGREYCLSL